MLSVRGQPSVLCNALTGRHGPRGKNRQCVVGSWTSLRFVGYKRFTVCSNADPLSLEWLSSTMCLFRLMATLVSASKR